MDSGFDRLEDFVRFIARFQTSHEMGESFDAEYHAGTLDELIVTARRLERAGLANA